MIIDFIIAAILFITIFTSMRKGFILTVANFTRGIFSIAAAWFFCDEVSQFLSTRTALDDFIEEKVYDAMTSQLSNTPLYDALPSIVKAELQTSMLSNQSSKLTAIIMTIFSFILIILVIRITLSLLTLMFSKQSTFSGAGLMDWILGIILGSVLGIINIFIFLALLVPVAGIIFPDHCQTILGLLDSSIIAGELYNNNFLIKLIQDFMA